MFRFLRTAKSVARADQPVFVLSCGTRTGSTWLQRSLTSTDDVLVWGETNLLHHLDNYTVHRPWTKDAWFSPSHEVIADLRSWRQQRGHVWTALLYPMQSDLTNGWAALLDTSLGNAARREGYERWGCKEVQWSQNSVQFLLKHWPAAKIIVLTREFTASLRSIEKLAWNHGPQGIEHFVTTYLRMAQQSHEVLQQAPSSSVRHFRYEDLRQNGLDDLLDWCDLPPAQPDVVSNIVGSADDPAMQSPPSTEMRDYTSLRTHESELNELARNLGYGPVSPMLNEFLEVVQRN